MNITQLSPLLSGFLVYSISRLIVALGFSFATFFTTAVLQNGSLPPLLQDLQESSFRWTSGDTELALPLPPPGTFALMVKAWPIRDNLEVKVRIAGEEIQTLLLTGGEQEYKVTLPLAAIEESRQTSHPLRVSFHSAAYSPQELTQGRSLDSRLLAFCLTSLSYFPSPQYQPLDVTEASIFVRGVYSLERAERPSGFLSFFRAAAFRWDAAWYADIVERGYAYLPGGGGEQNVRFFPLYPIICRGLHKVIPLPLDLLMEGVANALAIAAVLSFSILASKTLTPEAAWAAICLFCFYPGSLFFSLPYTESLMALLVILFLLFLQQQRFVLAALACGLATACRPTGVVLVPALAWEYYASIRSQSSFGRALAFGMLVLMISVSGVASYAFFLHWQFGEALAFARVASALPAWPVGWQWDLISGAPVRRMLLEASHRPLSLFIVPRFFNALAFSGAIFVLLVGGRYVPRAWLITGLGLAAMPYVTLGGSSQGVGSMTRFLAVDVPVFLCGGLLLVRYGLLRWLPGFAALLAIVLFIFSALFATGSYFVG